MAEEQQELGVDTIVDKAFEYFEKFVNRNNDLDSILLEGLEPDGDGWIVSIGFDGTRKETSEPSGNSAFGALSGFGSKTTRSVREVRHIHLDTEGRFQKLA